MAERLPLADVKVLDLTWVVAGPTVGRVMADYGATVVRVESAKRIDTARVVGPNHAATPGPEQSALYGNVNAGKLGLTLDLSHEAARDVVRDLVRWSDVVAEAFSPGVMRAWRLDYEELRLIKPDLIMLSTCLLGQTGPYARVAGFGNQGAALAGFQNLAGWPDRPPSGPYGPYTDYVAPRFSLAAILAALDHRRRTGEGTFIDQAQAESAMHFLAPALIDYFATGREVTRAGNRDPQMAPHGVYRCQAHSDERASWVAIVARSDDEWDRLARAIGRPELATDSRFASAERRCASADLLDEILTAWTIERTASEVESTLQAQGIPAHALISSADAVNDPQLQHRGHFIELEHPIHGTTVVEASRYKLSRTPAVIRAAAPTFGRDNACVLKEILKYSDDRIAELVSAGILD